MKKAVILFSGGLDSTTCLAWAKDQGWQCYALSFDYQQRHKSELVAARKIAKHFAVAEHCIVPLAAHLFMRSSLVNRQHSIPENAHTTDQIPNTYVPARNTIFLSMALAWAETLGACSIVTGASSVDFSNYPDCRPEFITAFNQLIEKATPKNVNIEVVTPLLHLSKAQTVTLGTSLGVDYRMTVSCYQANEQGEACGKCDSCYLRKKGFAEAGFIDATNYKT